ncbi:hypothetical protein KBX19_10530 [Corynebacterium sp. CCUG 71335]|uniref:hypothetical protein n=1 Tax=unclassified Corynebacterium TaxID=2624378 RepID=UPI00210D78A3|nr:MULTISPECIES: hypothetical protein [unclassified Corynebacterium]MCQ4621641.1 hypothetical protein [Corynebacterium sp. CCUG 71335]MCQ4627464.1 hypothetical protein [Corynebacterium sp. CCUG 65737]
MIHFLIEYHRPTGRLEVTPYEDAREAAKERINRQLNRPDTDTEVVVILSDSLRSLRQTHSRYFASEDAIIHDLVPANA